MFCKYCIKSTFVFKFIRIDKKIYSKPLWWGPSRGLRYDDISLFFDDIKILIEKNDDTAILAIYRRYDDIDQKMDDIATFAEINDDIAIFEEKI